MQDQYDQLRQGLISREALRKEWGMTPEQEEDHAKREREYDEYNNRLNARDRKVMPRIFMGAVAVYGLLFLICWIIGRFIS